MSAVKKSAKADTPDPENRVKNEAVFERPSAVAGNSRAPGLVCNAYIPGAVEGSAKASLQCRHP